MSGIVTPFALTPTTWNPSDKAASVTLSGGNLTAVTSTNANGVRSIASQSAGKWYIEITVNAGSTGSMNFGFCTSAVSPTGMTNGTVGTLATVMINANATNSIYSGSGTAIGNWVASSSLVTCIAIDLTARLIWCRGPTGTWNNSGTADPGSAVGGLSISTNSWTAGTAVYVYWAGATAGISGTLNAGASAFTGAAPSGFNAGFGTVAPTTAQLTQIGLEQWAQGTPQAQLTQMAVEHWAAVGTTPPQVVLTQIGIEQWASVALATVAQQARAIIMA